MECGAKGFWKQTPTTEYKEGSYTGTALAVDNYYRIIRQLFWEAKWSCYTLPIMYHVQYRGCVRQTNRRRMSLVKWNSKAVFSMYKHKFGPLSILYELQIFLFNKPHCHKLTEADSAAIYLGEKWLQIKCSTTES